MQNFKFLYTSLLIINSFDNNYLERLNVDEEVINNFKILVISLNVS